MEFFRHCPGCGRRFHIKVESKKLAGSHTESIPTFITGTAGHYAGRGMVANTPLTVPNTPLTVLEGKPIIVDVEEFRYLYKCGHCGHEWSETHVQEHRAK